MPPCSTRQRSKPGRPKTRRIDSDPLTLADFSIAFCDWQAAGAALRAIREAVFIQEQAVPVALEWDGLDEHAQHLLACDDHGLAIGCARILANGVIGRMAVLPAWRRRGVGAALLAAAVEHCRVQGCLKVRLSAQTHAIGFYKRVGFVVCSEPYLDAGIPHQDMHLDLSA